MTIEERVASLEKPRNIGKVFSVFILLLAYGCIFNDDKPSLKLDTSIHSITGVNWEDGDISADWRWRFISSSKNESDYKIYNEIFVDGSWDIVLYNNSDFKQRVRIYDILFLDKDGLEITRKNKLFNDPIVDVILNLDESKSRNGTFRIDVSSIDIANSIEKINMTALIDPMPQLTISGTITGADEVTVLLSGDATDSMIVGDGDSYHYTVEYGGDYTITPSAMGLDFTPTSKSYQNMISDQIQNFKVQKYFSIGSTMEEVREVQGTPDSSYSYEFIDEIIWYFGSSNITFSYTTKLVKEYYKSPLGDELYVK